MGFWVTLRNFGIGNESDMVRFVDTLTGVIRIADATFPCIPISPYCLMREWGATGCLANASESFYRC